eukprot:13176481-Ditylum_brightwellii.AAC.1
MGCIVPANSCAHLKMVINSSPIDNFALICIITFVVFAIACSPSKLKSPISPWYTGANTIVCGNE